MNYKNEFDIINIDGRDRVKCAEDSLSSLNSTGVIIWDNSHQEKYISGYKLLLEEGFKSIDFKGLAPINPTESQTTIFIDLKTA